MIYFKKDFAFKSKSLLSSGTATARFVFVSVVRLLVTAPFLLFAGKDHLLVLSWLSWKILLGNRLFTKYAGLDPGLTLVDVSTISCDELNCHSWPKRIILWLFVNWGKTLECQYRYSLCQSQMPGHCCKSWIFSWLPVLQFSLHYYHRKQRVYSDTFLTIPYFWAISVELILNIISRTTIFLKKMNGKLTVSNTV